MERYTEREKSEFYIKSECEILENSSDNSVFVTAFPNKIALPKLKVHNMCSLSTMY